MSRTRRFALLLLFLGTASLRAQDNHILISGIVRNLHTSRPQPHCLVQLLQGGVAQARRVADEEGYFLIDSLPAGTYTLQVSVGLLPALKAEMELLDDAHLSLFVDTLQTVNLRTVTISDQRPMPPLPNHELGEQLITSADDIRLWNLSGRMTESGPACADLSTCPASNYFAGVARMKAIGHLWYTKPAPPTRRRPARRKANPAPPADNPTAK